MIGSPSDPSQSPTTRFALYAAQLYLRSASFFCYSLLLHTATMAPRKRAFATAITPPKKRVKVTSSQPATGSIQPSSPPQSSRLSPRKALVKSSQAPTFESQLRETQAEAKIIAPLESSEAATIAPSSTADDGAIDEALDESLEDQFDGINWQRLRLYMKPLSSARARKSWVFKYGWRVALLKDPDRIFFVCFYCHKH